MLSKAIDWIAGNDESAVMDRRVIEGQITVALVADVYGLTREQVASMVWARRREMFHKSDSERILS